MELNCRSIWPMARTLLALLAMITPLSRCNTLQHAATYRNALQHTRGCECSTLSTLNCTTTATRFWIRVLHTAGAIRCYILHHIVSHRNTLQHTATHCNTLQLALGYECSTQQVQHTVLHCTTLQRSAHTAIRCNTLLAMSAQLSRCNTLQHTASLCNPLQHAATYFSTKWCRVIGCLEL